MTLKRIHLPPLLLALLVPVCAAGQTPFSLDSAALYLHTIAVDIGPRPMGSVEEHAAMEYALAKFRDFGIQETGILALRSTTRATGRTVNTNSGTAYGVLRGKSSRVIVLGGHIDSAGPNLPGANDDGSGSAAVIELARVLAARNNESTFVFALFGGEEQGLKGSTHFVDNFPMMGDVVLMIQLDMTNGSEVLIPLIGADGISAPEWLVTAAYEEAAALGITSLSFPTHFLALNNAAPGGGIGSDHMPFLQKGIPAIDFTSDINDPIHTPQDTYENFTLSGLKRSGDLAYRLIERFDGGVPEPASGRYFLIQFGAVPVFVPPAALLGLIVVCVGLGIGALILLRRRRTEQHERATLPGLKLFLLVVIIQIFVWISESIVEWIKGDRFPWYKDSWGFFLLGFLGGVLALWVCARLIPRMGFSSDPYRYALRSVIVMLMWVALTGLASAELAVYPAWGLGLLAVAFLVRRPWIRLILWLAAPVLMVRLIFSEGFGLLSRAMTLLPGGLGVEVLYHTALIFFFTLWSFPFALAFMAIRFDSGPEFPKLRWFTSPSGGIATAFLFTVTVVWLSLGSSYSRLWQQQITVRQWLDAHSGSGRITVTSNEYLDGARILLESRDTTITDRTLDADLGEFTVPGSAWIELARTSEISGDSAKRHSLLLSLSFERRPTTFSLRYRSGPGQIRDISTPFVHTVESDGFTLEWYGVADSVLVIPVSFTVTGAAALEEEATASYSTPLIPVSVQKVVSCSTVETEVVRCASFGTNGWETVKALNRSSPALR